MDRYTVEEYIMKLTGHYNSLEEVLTDWGSMFAEDYPEEAREFYRIYKEYNAAKNAYDKMVLSAYAKCNHRES